MTVHPASWPSRSVTWNKIPPNDNIQFQLCQHVLSAPVQSPSKTKGEGAWRGNSSFLLLWHVVTWTPWKTSPVIPAWGPLYSTGRGCGGHDLPDRLCWNMPRRVETDLNKCIGWAGDGPLWGLPREAEYRLVHGLTIHIRLYSVWVLSHITLLAVFILAWGILALKSEDRIDSKSHMLTFLFHSDLYYFRANLKSYPWRFFSVSIKICDVKETLTHHCYKAHSNFITNTMCNLLNYQSL